MDQKTKNPWLNWLPILVLGIVALTHLSYIPNGFIWLDHSDIEQKKAVLPLASLPSAFIRPFSQTRFYRPLVTVFHSIDASLYGTRAWGFHITNILLHLATVAAVSYFSRRFFHLSHKESWIIALLFGIHPSGILIAGGIIYRQESLLLLCALISLTSYMKARETNHRQSKVLSVVFFALALLSKETALFIVPGIAILWEILHTSKKRYSKEILIASLLVTLTYVFVRIRVIPDFWQPQPLELPIGPTVAVHITRVYTLLVQMISPVPPGASDAIFVPKHPYIIIISGIIVLLGLIGMLKRFGARSNAGKILLLLTILVLPASGAVPLPRLGSPHYGYITILPVAVMFVLATKKYRAMRAILVGWIIIASVTTFMWGYHFVNDETFFTHEVERDPNFREGYYFLGTYYLTHEDNKKACDTLQTGLQIPASVISFSDRTSMLVNYGTCLYRQRQMLEASEIYNLALLEAPIAIAPYIAFNSALTSYALGDHARVVELLSLYDWENKQAVLLLSDSLKMLGKEKESLEAKTRADSITE